MPVYKVGPTGQLIQGHLFDVNKASFTEALRRFDPDLYLHWNTKKRRGLGCWEIRIRPTPIWVHQGSHEGVGYYTLERIESDLIHHVADVPFLNYDAITRLKPMHKHWVRDYEYKEQKYIESQTQKIKNELKYNLKQDKSIYKAFQEMVSSGVNPALLAKYWGQTPHP